MCYDLLRFSLCSEICAGRHLIYLYIIFRSAALPILSPPQIKQVKYLLELYSPRKLRKCVATDTRVSVFLLHDQYIRVVSDDPKDRLLKRPEHRPKCNQKRSKVGSRGRRRRNKPQKHNTQQSNTYWSIFHDSKEARAGA